MARLLTSGFESQIASTVQAEHGDGHAGSVTMDIIGTAAYDTTNQRSGAACRSYAQGTNNFEQIDSTSALNVLDRAFFIRAYYRFSDATPSTAARILEVRDSTVLAGFVRLQTSGKLALFDANATQVGSDDTLVLSDNTWYRVELKVIIPAAGNGTLELRREGVQVAASSAVDVNNSATTFNFRIGNPNGNGQAGVTTYVDDVAVNDDQGANQNSWPGPGKIVTLWPASHNNIGTWVGPQTTGDDTSNLQTNVDNRPPQGVAHSDADANADKYVFNITNAANQNFDLNTDTYSAAGITANDTIKIVQGFVRASVDSTTGTNTLGVEVVSNPAIAASTGNNLETSAIAGTEPTGWKTYRTGPSYSPSVTLGSAAVIRGTKTDASTRANMIDQMGVIVEYLPGVERSAAVGATGAIATTIGGIFQDGGPAPEPIIARPPNTAGYTTRTITLAEANGTSHRQQLLITLDDATDYVIDASAGVIKRTVKVDGGRNIVWIGGHVRINNDVGVHNDGQLTTPISWTDGPSAVNRTIHVEGIRMSGNACAEGMVFNTPTAKVQGGYLLTNGRMGPRSSDSFGGTDQLGDDGMREYQGLGHEHTDCVQFVTGGHRDQAVFDHCTFESGVTAVRVNDGTVHLRKVNTRGVSAALEMEGPVTETVQWSSQGVISNFDGSVADSWTTAVGSATLGFDTSTPLNGSASRTVTRTATTKLVGCARSSGSPLDWSNGGLASAVSCLFRLDAGGGDRPMARIDVCDVSGATASQLHAPWHLGEAQKVDIGSTVRLVCNFPVAVLGSIRFARVVLIPDGRASTTHTFTFDDFAYGGGGVTRVWTGPTDLSRDGHWGLSMQAGVTQCLLDEVYHEVLPDNTWERVGSSGGGDNHTVREWDLGTAAYILDPPPGDATLEDGFFPSPPASGTQTDSVGDYVTWSGSVGAALRNVTDTQPGRVYEGPPASGDFTDSSISGLYYETAGYIDAPARTAAIDGAAGIATSGVVIRPRSAAVGATGAITIAGEIESPGAEFERSAAIGAVGAIAMTPERELERSAAIGAVGTITTTTGAPVILAPPFFVREPERLTVAISVRGGDELRFGRDAADAGEVPIAVSWSTQNPGGYGDASVTVARPPWISAADAPLFGEFRIYGRGGALRWLGRVKGTPEVSDSTIQIDGEGLAAALSDNEFFRFLGVHNDYGEWHTPTIGRQQALIAVGRFPSTEGTVEPDTIGSGADATGLPALVTRMTLPFESGTRSEMWLRPQGMLIGQILGSWEKGNFVDETNADIYWGAVLGSDEESTEDDTGNLRAAGPGTFSLAADGDRTAAMVQIDFATAATDFDGTPLDILWYPSVFGTHGLAPRELPDGRWGLLDEDVVIRAFLSAPRIPFDRTAIIGAGFTIPHVVHSGTAQELIEFVSTFGGDGGRQNDWGVYETAFWRPPGWGRTWRVRRDETASPAGAGPVAGDQCTGVVATYQDGAGRELSVGPPGSGADYETSVLADTSPKNPASRLVDGRTKRIEAGLTTRNGAVNIAAAWLREFNADTRSQSIELIGEVEDESGATFDASEVRACDQMVIADEGGVGPPETQQVVGTQYDHSTETLSAELGLPKPSVEALLARLAARTPQ